MRSSRCRKQPSLELAVWYQHLFQHELGRECLSLHRRELCHILWRQWSPTWAFDDATFGRTAAAFDNPDFVDVVIHAYRFSFGLAARPIMRRCSRGGHEHRVVECGHNFPWERPEAFADAILTVRAWTSDQD